MKDRGLYKTMRGMYVPAVWNGTNESGWEPTGAMVLIKADEAAQQSAGGIQFADDTKERQGLAAEAGVIVAVGPTAFMWADRERTTRWEGKKPQVGDRVCYQRYSGVDVPGDDGVVYHTMNDFSIGATRSAPAVVVVSGITEINAKEAQALLARIGQNGKGARKRATA